MIECLKMLRPERTMLCGHGSIFGDHKVLHRLMCWSMCGTEQNVFRFDESCHIVNMTRDRLFQMGRRSIFWYAASYDGGR